MRGTGPDPLSEPVTTRNPRNLPRQDEQNAVTGSDSTRDQPVTVGRLLSLIAHAEEILRSNPEVFPLLRTHPSLRTHARALTEAAAAGEDVDTLATLADTLDRNLYRIREGTQQASPDKFTNGRAKDRLNRKAAQPRTTAPARRTPEVNMRATAASAEVKKPARRATRPDPKATERQLTDEYTALAEQGHPLIESGLLAHAMTCLIPALGWVGGDPLTVQFPIAFESERLAKTCAWLRGLANAPAEQVEAARTQMLTALHQLWPAYCGACSDTPLSEGQEYVERQWDFVNRIDSLWVDPAPGKLNEPAPYLPEFRDTECGRVSYSFHLTLLALVTLNRQTGRPLLAFELEMN
ncbi:hypothetical protein [Deinococcus sp. DB0503]|uniref:hypothetical protein n=1 Tax=Deinococcus sp. DB0503 TaxID=2479203 RepID=UPI0018E03670|nr:hypothetical protein [Deinococcus sp. DB0503]MBI0447201.1 hypothetical protein [Deinococcus sp. DB0503]